jgi:hypothetical protein
MPERMDPMNERLDYFGVNTGCGCITAWMSSDGVTRADISEFYANMAKTDREVRRMEFTEELRQKINRCSHKESSHGDD